MLKYVAALFVVAVGILLALPTHFDPVAFRYSSTDGAPEFTGPLAVNQHIANARRVFQDTVQGPEAFAAANGYVYTGLKDGRIIRFNLELSDFETILESTCAINECGRPLGLKFHPRDANKLYVAYSRKGLLLYHLDTKQWETLVDCRQPGEGITPLMILNDMVPLSNDSVFFTDMSDKYGFHEVEEEVVEGRPHGRLFHYNPTDKSLRVVLESLHSPNGMAVGPDEQFVLFPETSRARVIRYYLKGSKAGTVDIFADNLPGLPDNITPSSGGGYWVGLGAVRDNGLLDMLVERPWLRLLGYKLKLMHFLMKLIQKHAMIIELDSSGRIVKSLHDPNGLVTTSVSSVLDLGDKLLLGSFFAPYIVAIGNEQNIAASE